MTTETVTGTITGGTVTLTIPTPAAGAQGPAGPAGTSPTAAAVAAALAATPSFVSAVAAAMGTTTTTTPTTPVVTTPTTPTTPTTGSTSITSPVFLNGKFDWAGDWNSVPFNYAFADAGVNGPGPVIQMPGTQQYEYWLPYPKTNSAGPASNGVNFPLTGLTHFTIAIKPSQAGAQMTMGFYTASGTTDDVPTGNSVTVTSAAYGPAAPVAGQWNVYTVPLTAFFNPVPAWIYKFIIQQQGVTPQVWEIDQVGFY